MYVSRCMLLRVTCITLGVSSDGNFRLAINSGHADELAACQRKANVQFGASCMLISRYSPCLAETEWFRLSGQGERDLASKTMSGTLATPHGVRGGCWLGSFVFAFSCLFRFLVQMPGSGIHSASNTMEESLAEILISRISRLEPVLARESTSHQQKEGSNTDGIGTLAETLGASRFRLAGDGNLGS